MTAPAHEAGVRVDIEGLTLAYPGGILALDGVDLRAASGELVAIVGASGCGKSTLLRVVAGLIAPTSGSVSFGMAPPRVAFVFQQPTLLPWRTVAGNVALPFEIGPAPTPPPPGRLDETLELVGLASFRDAYPHQLSGGMQMRVSLARALVTRPQLLLLDEPFGALDEITRQRLNEELLAIWERDRWTALFVTHNVFEAAYLGDRVVVLSSRPGRVAGEVAVDLPHPRQASVRAEAAFARIAGEVSSILRRSYAP